MLSDGVLMRMTKDDFVALVRNPSLSEIYPEEAKQRVANGARWLDVRLPEEHAKQSIAPSINIPFAEIRERMSELDPSQPYVVYCNAGGRSSAAAFLLHKHGFSVDVLLGGLLGFARPGTDAAAGGTPGGAAPTKPVGSDTDTSGLRAELARVNAEVATAIQDKAEADAARQIDSQAAHMAGAQKELSTRQATLERSSAIATKALDAAKQRKLELESEIRAAEAEEDIQREQAEALVQRLREEAEAKLEQEKSRLQTEYSQAASEMEKLKRTREEAEAKFRQERERLEAEFEKSREVMASQAQRIRAEVETAKRTAEKKAEAIRREHSGKETRLREETEAKLRAERRRLEAEFARSIVAQEKARQQLGQAQEARNAAQREAADLAVELKRAEQARLADQKAKRRAEQQRIDTQAKAAQNQLARAEQAKQEAEESKRDLSSTIIDIKSEISSKAEAAKRESELRADLVVSEAKVVEAGEQIDAAKRAQEKALLAKKVAEEKGRSPAGGRRGVALAVARRSRILAG